MSKKYSDKPLVFVYGSLKEHFPDHLLLEDSHKLATTSTANKSYVLLELSKKQDVPAVVHWTKHYSNEGYKIVGELYEVTNKILLRLDTFQSNGVIFSRESVELSNGFRAWMYILNFMVRNPTIILPNTNNCQFWNPGKRNYL